MECIVPTTRVKSSFLCQFRCNIDGLPVTEFATNDGDHIARIKYYKNGLVSHSTNCKLSDADFASTWNDLEMPIHGLGNHQESIDATAAKSRILDYNSVKRLMYRHEILNQRLEDQATKISKLETVNIQQNRKRLNDQTKSAYILQKHSSKMAKLETTVENMETEESLQLYEEHTIEDAKYKNILDRALQQIKVSDKDEKESNLTHRSEAHSRTSSNSTCSSSVAIRKRAKAEAAQAKLAVATEEAVLQKQKAHIEEHEKVASAKTFTKKAELEAELELFRL
ncbi:unnamed protein product [Mytilus edulis]|uniref:DZIP3-like HEPN domain-containing protein n=1 Tax=Mytilus edulis TaxID=6550 RepID=A0A8S3UQM9_MYTED|nr:unnamed protein product [Mytilus edulis]